MRATTLLVLITLFARPLRPQASAPEGVGTQPTIELPAALDRWRKALRIIGAYRYGSATADQGKFTLTLRRDRDGRWLIASDMDNGDRSAEAA